jgi:hypothetical protein
MAGFLQEDREDAPMTDKPTPSPTRYVIEFIVIDRVEAESWNAGHAAARARQEQIRKALWANPDLRGLDVVLDKVYQNK